MNNYKMTFTADHKRYKVALLIVTLLIPLSIYGTYRHTKSSSDASLSTLTFDCSSLFFNKTDGGGDTYGFYGNNTLAFSVEFMPISVLTPFIEFAEHYIDWNDGIAEFSEDNLFEPTSMMFLTYFAPLNETPRTFQMGEEYVLLYFQLLTENGTETFSAPYGSIVDTMAEEADYYVEGNADPANATVMREILDDLLSMLSLSRLENNNVLNITYFESYEYGASEDHYTIFGTPDFRIYHNGTLL